MREVIDIPGEVSREALWLSVGRAMSEFQKIELAMRGLFARLVDGDDSVSLAIFDGAGSTSNKMALLNETAKHVNRTRLAGCGIASDEINTAMKKVGASCSKRNLIAHSVVAKVFQFPGGDLGFWLQASKRGNTLHCNCADIDACIDDFSVAQAAVAAVTAKLMKRAEV